MHDRGAPLAPDPPPGQPAPAPAGARVLVSIVHWNAPEQTARCLAALARQDDRDFEVWVIDNASTLDAREAVAAAFPDAHLITLAENVGFAAGHARALEQAEAGGFAGLWLLNSDAEPEPDALRRLREAWRAHGDALYGSALIDGPPGAPRLQFPAKFLQAGGGWRRGGRDADLCYDERWRSRPAVPVAALVGASMLIPLALIRRHGFIDPAFFLYCEEIDYCLRLSARGVPSLLVPASRVRHIGGGSQRGQGAVADMLRYYQTRNEIELWRRHGGPWVAWIVFRKLLRVLYALVAEPARARYHWLGLCDGLGRRLGKRMAPESAWRGP
jgi:GT2 family glycosyltransferase